MGSETSGDLAEDNGGPQGALAAIISVRHIASGDKEEKIVAAFSDGPGRHRQVGREQAGESRVGRVNGRDDDGSRPNLRRLSIPC